MNPRATAAAERLREAVPILDVLLSYGYRVRDDGGYREQQFSCDLHGSGQDAKPSARVYPDSNTWYCFGCDLTRDAIQTVRAKEGISFWEAVGRLEKTYNLDPLPKDYREEQPAVQTQVEAALDPHRTWDQDAKKMERFLHNRTRNKDLPLPDLLWYWEKFDEICFRVHGTQGHNCGGSWSEATGRVALQKLQDKFNKALKDTT